MLNINTIYFEKEFNNFIKELVNYWLTKTFISRSLNMSYRNLCILYNKNKSNTIRLKSENIIKFNNIIKKLGIKTTLNLTNKSKENIKKQLPITIYIKNKKIIINSKKEYINLIQKYKNIDIILLEKQWTKKSNLWDIFYLF